MKLSNTVIIRILILFLAASVGANITQYTIIIDLTHEVEELLRILGEVETFLRFRIQ